jgi:hypothetical protein
MAGFVNFHSHCIALSCHHYVHALRLAAETGPRNKPDDPLAQHFGDNNTPLLSQPERSARPSSRPRPTEYYYQKIPHRTSTTGVRLEMALFGEWCHSDLFPCSRGDQH